MLIKRSDTLAIQSSDDVVRVRQDVRRRAAEVGFGIVDQTKIVTASSELARNTLDYGGGGRVHLQMVENGVRKGLRLIFEDEGPGIADVERALTDGYSSGSGMGLGLSGARRLSNEFSLETEVGKGTRVTIARWK
ncbi:MAG: ATP-binding protein [Caulobacteraceae bacterium]